MADGQSFQSLGFPVELSCPYCGGDLEPSLSPGPWGAFGTLRCGCYRYPVLEGIPILRQLSSIGSAVDPVVQLLDRGERVAALNMASDLDPPRRSAWIPPALSRRVGAIRHGEPPSFDGGLGPTLRQTRTARYADYLFHRYANNSYMAASVLISLLDGLPAVAEPAPVALDLPSGIGHASFLLAALQPGLRVMAADYDFASLRVARRYVAPQASLVCLDANLPLPFPADAIDVCLCLDGLHYIRAKRTFAAEVDRVLRAHGVWLLPHLHNAAGENVAPGIALTPEGYAAQLHRFSHRIASEALLLRAFVDDGCCDLGALEPEPYDPVLAVVAARDAGVFKAGARPLVGPLARPVDVLGLNPVYRLVEGDGPPKLRLRWPDDEMRRECATAEALLSPEIALSRSEAAALDRSEGVAAEIEGDRVAELVKRFVLVPLPPGYR